MWPLNLSRECLLQTHQAAANQNQLRHSRTYDVVTSRCRNKLFSDDFLDLLKKICLNQVSGHNRPVSRFKGLYLNMAVTGKIAFWGYGIHLLQYLEWPLGGIGVPENCLSSYYTCNTSMDATSKPVAIFSLTTRCC